MHHLATGSLIALILVTGCSTSVTSAPGANAGSSSSGTSKTPNGGSTSTSDTGVGGASVTSPTSSAGGQGATGTNVGGAVIKTAGDGGTSATSIATGGASDSAMGGSATGSTLGGATQVATGGMPAAAGAVSTGGASASGGTPTGGTSASGGSAPCVCVNPHLATCQASCDSGTCKTSVIPELGAARQSGDKANTLPRTGFWDSEGNAYVAYPQDWIPYSISLQRLDANGAFITNAAAIYALPGDTVSVQELAVAFDGSKVGLLWHAGHGEGGVANGVGTVDFATTTTAGTASTPITLNEGVLYGKNPGHAAPLALYPLGSNLWATITNFGDGLGYTWRGYVINAVTPAPNPSFAEFAGSPASIARSNGWAIPQASAVVNNTLFVTGYDWTWSPSTTPINLLCNRYDLRSFAPLTPLSLQLSVNSILPNSTYQRTPVIAKLGNRLAAFWTEFTAESFDTSSLHLGSAQFEENGSAVVAPTAVKSRLIPKALVETPSGAGLFIAARVDASGATPTFTLVAQRIDANLKFVGSEYAINDASTSEPTRVEAHRSPNGRLVLVTFRQDFAQHRILHADLCQ